MSAAWLIFGKHMMFNGNKNMAGAIKVIERFESMGWVFWSRC